MKNGRLLILFLAFLPFSFAGGQNIHAEKGVMDLRRIENVEKFNIALLGEWAFYWNKRLTPNDFKTGLTPEPDFYGHVPAYWTEYKIKTRTEKYGYATYRLVVVLPPGINHKMALDVPVFDSAFDLWINDSLFCSAGQPGKTEETTIPGYKPQFLRYIPKTDTLNLLVNVSNFHHRRGGFWMPMRIGSYDQVQKSKAVKYARDYSTSSLLAGFALFFLIFFLLSPKDRILGYFALALIGLAMRPFFTSGYLIYDFADMNWQWTVRFEYISLYLIMFGWAWFADSLYPSRLVRKMALVLTVIYSAAIIITLFLKVRVFSYCVLAYYPSTILLIMLFLYKSFGGLMRKSIFDTAYFFAFALLSAGAVNDILVSLGRPIGSLGYVMPYVVVIFIFVQAVLLLYKWIFAYYEKEKLQLRLEFMNRNLEELIQNRTKELQARTSEVETQNLKIAAQNRQLSETISLKNKIFSVLAHDLRSPVVNILYMLNLLKEKEYKEKYDTFANTSIQYAQMVINLLENMLVWGRGQEEKIKFSPAEHDLASMILTNLSIFKESSDRKEIDVNFTQKGNSYAYYDKDLMDIVIRNLISNAIKYTRKGGRISILLKDRASEDGKMVVKICDNGIGIPETKQKYLFTSTEIESTPGTDNEKGTGLGLKLCQELVTINHGTISVESSEDGGTCFQITLPAEKSLQQII
jgi:signal transduction histidine kinase